MQMYTSIWCADLASLFSHLDLFTLLFAAICHDLDHPGLTNAYQVGGANCPLVRSFMAEVCIVGFAFYLNDHSFIYLSGFEYRKRGMQSVVPMTMTFPVSSIIELARRIHYLKVQ